MRKFTPIIPGGLYEEEIVDFKRKVKRFRRLVAQRDMDDTTRDALRQATDIIESLLTHIEVARRGGKGA